MIRAFLVATAALLAGCVAPADVAPTATEDLAAALVATPPVRISTAQPAREPSIVEAPDGTLFVAGYWGAIRFAEAPPPPPENVLLSPLVWRSRDGGATWERLATGLPVENAWGNSDISLAVDADGRIFAASLVFGFLLPTFVLSLAPPEAGLPGGVAVNLLAVGVSEDGGDSWTWAEPLARGPFVDRPWIRVGSEGTAHVVWNDGAGVYLASSADAGATWSRATRVHPAGGAGGFAASPEGPLAIRLVPTQGNGIVPAATDEDALLLSADGGATWTRAEIPGNRTWARFSGVAPDGVPRVWDTVAFDESRRVCVAWAEVDALLLACSADSGATWSTRLLSDGSQGQPHFPFLSGSKAGLAASWFANRNGVVSAHVARIEADGIEPLGLSDDVGGSPNGEYFEVVRRADGTLAAAFPVTDDGQWLDFRLVGLR